MSENCCVFFSRPKTRPRGRISGGGISDFPARVAGFGFEVAIGIHAVMISFANITRALEIPDILSDFRAGL